MDDNGLVLGVREGREVPKNNETPPPPPSISIAALRLPPVREPVARHPPQNSPHFRKGKPVDCVRHAIFLGIVIRFFGVDV